MQKIEAVIFDLDGTLLYTLEDLTDSCNQAMKFYGFPEHTLDEVRMYVGNGLPVLAELAIPDGTKNPLYKDVLLKIRECYAKNWKNKTKPYDGIIDMLRKLNQNKIKCGIVSNKPDAQVKELSDLFFKGCISSCAGEKEGIRRKPYPDSVNKVIGEFGIPKENTIYVGDSDVDIATAKNVGVKCVSCSWGFRSADFLKAHGAGVIIEKPEQLGAIVNCQW